MQNIILTIHLIVALALIIVVLLQRSEGGGLGIGGGGGGGIMTGRGAATALSKLTWALGIAFVVTSLTLTILSARSSGSSSVLDRLGVDATAPAAPAPTSGDLLAPAPAPAAPAAGTEPAAPADGAAEPGPAAPPPVK
ncbi:MAG: preprotein translocase subunit SecG [Amaricoccus sp.]